jgi:hypothetical protein
MRKKLFSRLLHSIPATTHKRTLKLLNLIQILVQVTSDVTNVDERRLFYIISFYSIDRFADLHHFFADPNTAFHFNADPYPAPLRNEGISDHWFIDPLQCSI